MTEMKRTSYKLGSTIIDKSRPGVKGVVCSITDNHYIVSTAAGRRRIKKRHARRSHNGIASLLPKKEKESPVARRRCGKRNAKSVVSEFGYDALHQRAIDEGVTVVQLVESLR